MVRGQRRRIEQGVTISEKGAVWIKFGEKPSDEIRFELRDAGFRFKRHQLAWVQKATEENVSIAEVLWERFEQEGGAE